MVWDADPNCRHVWGAELIKKQHHTLNKGFNERWGNSSGAKKQEQGKPQEIKQGAFCQKCGAWRGSLGLEKSPEGFIRHLVQIFRGLRRTLRDDGVVYVNLGDSFNGSGGAGGDYNKGGLREGQPKYPGRHLSNMKPKDQIGIPFMFALAMRDDGWWWRDTVIWHKANCLGGGVRVYAQTQKGETPMMIKDLVRLDPATVKLWNGIKWTQAISWTLNSNPDKRLEIKLRSGEKIACTGDHLWPTNRGNVKASRLRVGDILQQVRLPEPVFFKKPSMLDAEDIGWLVGTYLADGSFGANGKCIQISSNTDDVRMRYRRLKLMADSFHGTCAMYETGGKKATVNLHCSVLGAVIDTYIAGKYAKGKHLSVKCWERSDVFLSALLDGYLAGDGHDDSENDRWRIGFTRNKYLADDFRTLCGRLGIHLRLHLATSTCLGKVFPSYKGEIRFRKSEHGNVKCDTEIVSIGKSNGKKFWDIAVEDDPHVFALASGVLTHNCMPASVTDRTTCDFEYVFMFAKNGVKPTFWTHRDGYGTRTKPKAEYRWLDKKENVELDVEPENWREEMYTPVIQERDLSEGGVGFIAWLDDGSPEKRYKRYGLWKGHAYYYDNEAIREDNVDPNRTNYTPGTRAYAEGNTEQCNDTRTRRNDGFEAYANGKVCVGRNKRSVWKISTVPYKAAHFACFPPALCEVPILATSSDMACQHCNAPWITRKEKTGEFQRRWGTGNAEGSPYGKQGSMQNVYTQKGMQPTCDCEDNDGSGVSIVLDLFAGASTTGVVSKRLRRKFIMIEMNPDYVNMSEKRLAETEVDTQAKLF